MVGGREVGSVVGTRPGGRWDTPVWVLDADERFAYVNESAERLFDQPQRKLEGKPFWSAVPEDVEDRYREAFAEVDDGGETAEFELRCPVLDGWFRIEAYPFGDRLAVHAHEITDEVRRRRELERRERALRDAHEIAADREASSEERIRRLLASIRGTLGTEFATLSRIDREGGTYESLYVDASDPDAASEGEEVPLPQMRSCADVAQSEQTLVLRDVEEQAPRLADSRGIESYLGTPVHVGDELFGTLCFYSTEPRDEAFSDWEITYVGLFADRVAVELERG